jgi:hypothetical protein
MSENEAPLEEEVLEEEVVDEVEEADPAAEEAEEAPAEEAEEASAEEAPADEPAEPEADAAEEEEAEEVFEGVVTQASDKQLFAKLRRTWLRAGSPRQISFGGFTYMAVDSGKKFVRQQRGVMGQYDSLSTRGMG